MYVQRNVEARSYNNSCSGKAYSECVFTSLVIQHAMHTRHIVICDLPVYTIFYHIIL
jgi:hypothetical protein